MKIKSALLVSVSMLLISPALLATTISKGKLIEHKEWTTGGASMVLKALPNADLKTRLKTHTTFTDDKKGICITEVLASTQSVKRFANTNINTVYDVIVVNRDPESKNVMYEVTTCVALDEHQSQCGHVWENIELEPDGYFYTEEQPILNIAFDQAGAYRTLVRVNIEDGEDIQYVTSSGLIEVTRT